MTKEITKKDFMDCIEKHDFFNSECYSECMDNITEDLQKNFDNKIVCDYAYAPDTELEDVIDYVMYCCQNRLIKGWLAFYEDEFVFWLIEYEETEPSYFLKKIKDTIENIQKEINGLSFVDAGKKLGGFNADSELFDFNYGLDDEYYINGTIYNKNGKAFIDLENSYFDIYREDSPKNVLKITYNEITEQLERID